ncbi:JAB domain-containing protein [Elusimicrobiota bacterium]
MESQDEKAKKIVLKVREIRLSYGKLVRTSIRLDEEVTSSPDIAVKLLRSMGCRGPEETMGVIYLNAKNKPVAYATFSSGAIDRATIHPAGIIRRALLCGAAAIIVGHNHPSGDTTPSKEDIELVRCLNKAATLLNITVHDSLILSDVSGYLSCLAEGLLNKNN